MNTGFSIGLLAGVAASIVVGLAAEAADLPLNPTPAEKKEYLASVVRAWDYVNKGDAPCLPALDEMKKGNVTFLAPAAFGETEKPQAVRDLEKQCPNLNLGLRWYTARDRHLPVTAKRLTEIYGEPSRAARNFTLYNVPFARGVRPVFVADLSCREGSCGNGGWLELIDKERCVKDTSLEYRGRYGGQPPSLYFESMNGVVQIGENYFFLELNNGTPNVSIVRIPEDINPNRLYGRGPSCSLVPK